MPVTGAGRQASAPPVSGAIVQALGALNQQVQQANRNPVAVPDSPMPGTYLLGVDDTAALTAGSGTASLTFTGDQALAHGVLREDDLGGFFLPCTGLTVASVNVASDHTSGYVQFSVTDGIGIPQAFSASPDTGSTQHLLIGPKGARVTATVADVRISGDPAVYSAGTVFLQPLGNDAIN